MSIINNYNFEDRFTIGSADYPFSLMQGLSGDITLIIDLLEDSNNSFYPGFEVWQIKLKL